MVIPKGKELEEHKRGISIIKDFKLLKVADMAWHDGTLLFPKASLDAIKPAQFETLPIQVRRSGGGSAIIGHTENVRREGDWFIADLKIMLDVVIEVISKGEKMHTIDRILGLILNVESFFSEKGGPTNWIREWAIDNFP